MSTDNRQKGLPFATSGTGNAPGAGVEGVEVRAGAGARESLADTETLMEEICERENCLQALKRVKANTGGAGDRRDDCRETPCVPEAQLTETKGVPKELDSWMRRRLRCLLWRQWKRPAIRARKLRALGLNTETARLSGGNGHGP